MEIFHLLVRPVRRAVGNSATATAARRSATAIEDHRTGLTFDFRNKRRPVYAEIMLPQKLCQHDVQWATVRADLWNAAETAER
jgi:MobA/MobL family